MEACRRMNSIYGGLEKTVAQDVVRFDVITFLRLYVSVDNELAPVMKLLDLKTASKCFNKDFIEELKTIFGTAIGMKINIQKDIQTLEKKRLRLMTMIN